MYLRLWAAFVTVMYSVDNSILILIQIYEEYVYSVVYWYHTVDIVVPCPRHCQPLSLYDYFLSITLVHVLHHRSLCTVHTGIFD